MNWRKSSHSGGGEGNTCVEIVAVHPRIAVRDSKAPSRGSLSFPEASFTALIDHLKEHPWSDAPISG
jgi:hypothetical protein